MSPTFLTWANPLLAIPLLILGLLYAAYKTMGSMVARWSYRFGFSDLADVACVLIASEPLDSRPKEERHYQAILEDFEAHRAVARDEVMIVERVDERPLRPVELMHLAGLPGDVV